jgi:hypothetical protein
MHTPRDCIGKNFAQMEMRTILTQLFRSFSKCPDICQNLSVWHGLIVTCQRSSLRTTKRPGRCGILRKFSFSPALEQPLFTAVPSQSELGNSVARGKNNGTMGPMDVDFEDGALLSSPS